MNNPNRTEPEP